jgi:hypothetical protein
MDQPILSTISSMVISLCNFYASSKLKANLEKNYDLSSIIYISYLLIYQIKFVEIYSCILNIYLLIVFSYLLITQIYCNYYFFSQLQFVHS